ncbi:MAG: dynamin family protein [Ruminococcus sp.]|nr:dynamin family protein [Ruminococcus sp.]MCM1381272.1 dynamin family protein [Muribaculaceae bacterium]MCM1479212.1 dynamin family protein [Muribaculaceae bacterium]
MPENNFGYSAAEADIESVQGKLKSLLDNKPLCTILGEEFTERLREWDAAITKRRTEAFSLVVLGDFKRGKSTIINAILGKSIAPVNVAPETFTINSISYSDEPRAEAVLKNGQRINLLADDLVREKLEKLMRAFPDTLDYIDIKDNAEILKEIRIVDTPGLSDLDCLDKQVQDYLVNADAVIYVASALSPFSESEQFFLASHIRPLSFNKLYVLVNMIDAMNTREDIEKIINRVSERCEAIMPNAFVYGVSGIDEYRRKIGLNRPDIKGFQDFYETEFLKFEMSLKREIILQKDVIRTQRVLTMLNLMIKDTAARIRMIYDMMAMDRKKLDDISQSIERECSTLAEALESKKPKILLSITEMQQEAEQWMYGFFSKLREDVLESRNTASPEDIDKHFYSYLVDKVGEAYRRCLDIHWGRLNSIIAQLGAELAKKLGIDSLAEETAVSADGKADNLNILLTQSVMDAASGGNGDSFPDGAMSSFRNILRKKRQTTDIVDTALENYDDIRSNTLKDLKAAYKDMEETALKQLDTLYQNQVNVSRDSLTHAMEMSSEVSGAAVKKYLEEAAAVLTDAARTLMKYA